MTKLYLVGSHLSGTIPALDVTGTGILPIRRPPPTDTHQGTVKCARSSLSIVSGVHLVADDVMEIGILPADHVIVDWLLTCDSWDANASPTLAANIGVMTGTVGDTSRLTGTVGTELAAAVVFGKTAVSVFVRGSSVAAARVAASKTVDRSIGLTITTAAATEVAATRQLDFFLFYRLARAGE
jgi:hypothetical protein